MLIGLAVIAVFGYLINEEQGEHLYALGEENQLLLKMGFDRFPDLNPPYGHFRNVSGRIARTQNMAIGELHRVLVGVDLGDDKASILVQLV